MAYVSQELKKQLEPAIKSALKKHGLKGSLSVSNHSTLVLSISKGDIDFQSMTKPTYDPCTNEEIDRTGKDYYDINTYHIDAHWKGKACEALNELKDAMMVGNFDKSDAMTDYFHVGWYIDISVGRYNKPYEYTGPKPAQRADRSLVKCGCGMHHCSDVCPRCFEKRAA